MNEIDGQNPALVRALAAQGFAIEDIAGMTRTEPAYVREVLAESAPEDKTPPVNTTSNDK